MQDQRKDLQLEDPLVGDGVGVGCFPGALFGLPDPSGVAAPLRSDPSMGRVDARCALSLLLGRARGQERLVAVELEMGKGRFAVAAFAEGPQGARATKLFKLRLPA